MVRFLLYFYTMKALKSWTTSNEFWERAEPLILEPRRGRRRKYLRRAGAGRKAMDPRKVLSAIVCVFRTGRPWKALPKEDFGSASSVHKYFLQWKRKCVFLKLWRKGLAEYDEMEGIALVLAKDRRGHGKGPDCTEICWAESNGPWEKMGPSKIFSSTVMESHCPWS